MTIYFDSSSLVKMYVAEAGSEEVRAAAARADLVATSSITYAEVRATLARLRRVGELTTAGHAELKRRFDRDWSALLTIVVTDSVAEVAGDLAETHALRGSDALQLASFVQLLQGAEDEEIEFSSFDDRLNKAAKSLS